MSFPEFVVSVAAIMALNPLAMDMMLPALPQIGTAFGIDNANHLQWVLSTFLLGFGIGQIVIGPLSDRYGRRPVLIGGMVVYAIASALAIAAPSFETLLLARVLQGLSTSATRVIATSVVRDCYVGRRMASVMSLAQMVFISVPVLAPSFGQLVLLASRQWHSVFVVLLLYGVIALLWTALRLPETLADDKRTSIRISDVLGYYKQTVTNRQTIGYALACGAINATMFGYVFSAQQIFTEVYHLGPYFPLAFAAIAIGVAVAGFVNSRIVGKLGMRVIAHSALSGFAVASLIMAIAARADMLPLPVYMALATCTMFGFGLTFANFTALAMEPQGHIAGTASSLFGSLTVLIGIAIGYLIGQAYDGTMVPLATGFFLCAVGALAIVYVTERGKMFQPHNQPVQT
ncbi:MAG TPA: multidrug effflux MFS transporter [Acetobacteraceae bacterium]|nr:multidrug effflux MFS transporter [Acetobacteraceae bacterium]